MTAETFNRFELKYLISADAFMKFERAILPFVELDSYNAYNKFYTVSNLYCDTDDFAVIRNSIEKPLYKEKLRLRAYGVTEANDIIFCEIKKKFRGRVNKRRSRVPLSMAYDFIHQGKIKERLPYMNGQVLNEIEYILNKSSLKPKICISYERKAYFGKDDKKLRVSFDTNIRSRMSDLKLESGSHGMPLLDKDLWLMEIKCFNVPLWLSAILSDMKIYPVSFSKYGNIYKKIICSGKYIDEEKKFFCPAINT